MTKRMIAIDGPAGAGKSTVAKALAKKLGYLYIDTGAMYRAVAYAAIQRGISFEDAAALTELAGTVKIDMKMQDGIYHVYLDGKDVSLAIRTPEVGAAASPVSAVSGVRRHLVAQQQRLAQGGSVVMDGRDIGTMVLPQADCKIFLTASLEERAKRRYLELQEKGIDTSLAQVKAEMAERDERDSHRADSPLRQAEDAVLLDNTQLSLAEVLAKLEALVKE